MILLMAWQFVQPGADPVWGHEEGIRVGLHPMGGPKGLLRIYAPYAGHKADRMINYVAVEPIVDGRRGLSEIEKLDFWSCDDDSGARGKGPAKGKIVDGNLVVFVFMEPFRNGARPYVQITFYKDRPYEVGFRAFAEKESKSMGACILSATMGNYARCRALWLKEETVVSTELYKAWKGADFAPHREWGLKDLARHDDWVVAAITPNEEHPAKADYAEGTPPWWHYDGAVMTQYWRRRDPSDRLKVRVNARRTYFGTTFEIPGGVSYENFELEEPFEPGQQFIFGVSPKTPRELGLRK